MNYVNKIKLLTQYISYWHLTLIRQNVRKSRCRIRSFFVQRVQHKGQCSQGHCPAQINNLATFFKSEVKQNRRKKSGAIFRWVGMGYQMTSGVVNVYNESEPGNCHILRTSLARISSGRELICDRISCECFRMFHAVKKRSHHWVTPPIRNIKRSFFIHRSWDQWPTPGS